MRHPQVLEEQKRVLQNLLQKGDKIELRIFFENMHPADAAGLVAQLLKKDQKKLFSLLSAAMAADVVEELQPAEQVQVVNDLPPEHASDIVEEMESDKGVDLLQDLPREKSEALLQLMEPQEAAQARELLEYPEDCAGGLMAKEFLALGKQLTLSEAVRALQSRSQDVEKYPISYVYVLDEAKRLAGVLRVRDLLLKNPSLKVSDVMIADPITVPAAAHLNEIQRLFDQYHLLALPVLAPDGKMLGIIRQESVKEQTREEAGRGLLKFTGIIGGEEYRDMSLGRRVKHRLPWLVVNIFLNFIAASVIAVFQETLQAVVAIAVFLPVISDMSGCSGGQAVAVSIRELALGRLSFGKMFWVFRKELAVGLLNGVVLGALIGLTGFLWKDNFYFGLVIATALWINTAFSVCIGGAIPIVLKKLDVDPAIASTPLLTTLTDTVGFLLVMLLTNAFLPYLTNG